MPQVSGSYESVILGVSQQVPQERRSGQMWEQVNMISDPVNGCARRHGSTLLDDLDFSTGTTLIRDATWADIKNFKTYTFFISGVEYVLIYRAGTKPTNSAAPVAWCFNKDTGQFINVVLHGSDTPLNNLVSGGVSAITSTGRFLFIAGNTIVPAVTTTNAWETSTNKRKTVVWVRGGAYSRTFRVTCQMVGGTQRTFSYTTMPSSYQGTLDTSDIPANATDYQKQVNDRTAAYNTAVTKHIGLAAADIQPSNIATQLRTAALAAGFTTVTRNGSHLYFADNQNIEEVSVDDGGDGSLIRGVGAEVALAEAVSNMHAVGKVVKVRPTKSSGEDAFYLKAYPKVEDATGFQEVVWREAPGILQQPRECFVYGTVKSGVLYLASTAAKLTSLTGDATPEIVPSSCGDDITSPLPQFIGRKIDYLGMFQDRLCIGFGAVLLYSRTGDYLNWFRETALTVLDNDPIEMFALGSEDDTIKHSITYDRNMVLFGRRKQYVVSGRTPLTPKTAAIMILSAFEDTVESPPMQVGNLVFYGKSRSLGASSGLFQLQVGLIQDSLESYEVSMALDRYIAGQITEIKAITRPSRVFMRSTGNPYGLYCYTYLDSQAGGERLFDSWDRWHWHTALGQHAGVAEHNGDMLLFTVREGKNAADANRLFICADRFTMETRLSPTMYGDSQVNLPYTKPASAGQWFDETKAHIIGAGAEVAIDEGKPEYMIGEPIYNADDMRTEFGATYDGYFTAGIPFDAYIEPTNPFYKDYKGKPVLTGRTTIQRFNVTLANTGGMTATITRNGVTSTAIDFTGRIEGNSTALIGRQPIVDTTVPVHVGRETREFRLRLKAKKWLPFTITALEWRGLLLNNTRRG